MIFDEEKLMVPYLNDTAIENQWLPSCRFQWNKNEYA